MVILLVVTRVNEETYRNPNPNWLSERGCSQWLTGAHCRGLCLSGVAGRSSDTDTGTLLPLLAPDELPAQAQVGGSPVSSRADLIPQEVAQARTTIPSPSLLAGRHVVTTKLATVVTEAECARGQGSLGSTSAAAFGFP